MSFRRARAVAFNRQTCFFNLRGASASPSVSIFGVALLLIISTFLSHAQPFIIQEPQSETVFNGQVVSLSVAAQGTTHLRFYWQFNGRTLPIRGRTLRFRATSRRAGTYQAIVRDTRGRVTFSAPAVIEVQSIATTPPRGGRSLPVIVVHPPDVTVQEHATAVFAVTLNNSGPYTTIIWHNDNPLEGSHQIPDGIGLDVHNPRLQIFNCLNADNYNGLYWLAVTNAAGGTVSRKARLTVIPAP